ncbi:MAG: hypothetical protein M1834_009746 [Cirrosporium novae-zelandiae]|nr:MAG: hypothetical protein M1834_009746 [Cirrosporium novae-zelandiae]
MASGSVLESWIREQYYVIGVNRNGGFCGKRVFKNMLINLRPKQKSEIRQVVNKQEAFGSSSSQIRTISSSISQIKPVVRSLPEEQTQLKFKTVPYQMFTANNQIPSKEVPVDTQDIIGYSMQNTEPHTLTPGTGKSMVDQNVIKQAISNPKIQGSTFAVDNKSQLKAYLKTTISHDDDSSSKNTDDIVESSMMDLQSILLSHEVNGYGDADNVEKKLSASDIANGVLFTADLLEHCDQSLLPQYGLLGSFVSKDSFHISASLNSLTENCLIRSPTLGVLQKPLSALVFHFGEYTSHSNFTPSEAAFLAIPNMSILNHSHVAAIRVLVSPSNYFQLNALYSQIPGVTVQPFKLHPQDLNIGTILTLMSVDQTQATPLYMGQVTKILRRMASESEGTFNYFLFKRQLDEIGFDRKQREFLDQRLDLLESFLDLKYSTTSPIFAAGEITILDLSCPFVDANTACILFQIGLRMYLESSSTSGKVVVVDEAHKYITDTPSSKQLTESLLAVIRQQRHYGTRVIISTQEPTISPQLIGLCSITIIHRFSSPEWFSALRKHVSTFRKEDENNKRAEELFNRILKLGTGQALVFAPTAIVRNTKAKDEWVKLSTETLELEIRKRMTWDGGKSVVLSRTPKENTVPLIFVIGMISPQTRQQLFDDVHQLFHPSSEPPQHLFSPKLALEHLGQQLCRRPLANEDDLRSYERFAVEKKITDIVSGSTNIPCTYRAWSRSESMLDRSRFKNTQSNVAV